MKFSKVTALPSTLVADHLYIVSVGETVKFYVTDKLGVKAHPLATDVNTSFTRYDLSVGTTTGALDLAVSQVYRILNNTATAKTVTLTNAPTDKAMTAVVVVDGDVGAVSFTGARLGDGVDIATLGAGSTIFVLFVHGTDIVVTSSIRVASPRPAP